MQEKLSSKVGLLIVLKNNFQLSKTKKKKKGVENILSSKYTFILKNITKQFSKKFLNKPSGCMESLYETSLWSVHIWIGKVE